MTNWTNLKSVYVSTGTSVYAIVSAIPNVRLRGFNFTNAGAAGQVVFRDGTPTAAIKFQMDIPSSVGTSPANYLADGGIRFEVQMNMQIPAGVTGAVYFDGA